jgi:hypothetical protein
MVYIPSLIENGVSPKLKFGYLVGVSSFWWWVENLEVCGGWLDGFVKIIGTAVSIGSAGPTIFSLGTHVLSYKDPAQKFCWGEVRPYL